MIKSFADKATEAVFDGWLVLKLPHDIQKIARRKLKLIGAVSRIEELRVPPGNRLELLMGDRARQWSIRSTINGGYVSDGKRGTQEMWKSLITTRNIRRMK